jgi:hypothetical protein
MKFAFNSHLILLFLFVNICSVSFAQKKKVVVNKIVEEIEYKYDTIFIEEIEQRIDTFRVSSKKPKIETSFYPNKLHPVNSLNRFSIKKDSTLFFIGGGLINYAPILNTSKINSNGLTAKSKCLISNGIGIELGVAKTNMLYSIQAEYKVYNESLTQVVPKFWQDTLDNGSEIYYRNIDGQLVSIIQNKHQFLQVSTAVGYQYRLALFSILTQAVIGSCFDISDKSYFYNMQSQKVESISQPANIYLVTGAACSVVYYYNKSLAFALKAHYQHSFIKSSNYPLSYRDELGVDIGVVYLFYSHL